MAEPIGRRQKLEALRAAFIGNMGMAIIGLLVGIAVPSNNVRDWAIGYGSICAVGLVVLLLYMKVRLRPPD